jgi:hypothetical protein
MTEILDIELHEVPEALAPDDHLRCTCAVGFRTSNHASWCMAPADAARRFMDTQSPPGGMHISRSQRPPGG